MAEHNLLGDFNLSLEIEILRLWISLQAWGLSVICRKLCFGCPDEYYCELDILIRAGTLHNCLSTYAQFSLGLLATVHPCLVSFQ